jgi:hypothetical protein
MNRACFVCLFLLLTATFMLSQSNPVPRLNQTHNGRFRTASRHAGSTQTSGLNFAPAVAYDSGGAYAISVAVADVNGDGKPDLVVANGFASNSNYANGTVGVLLGNGDGTFQTSVTYGSGGYYANFVAVADVNGDGKPDLVVANMCASGNSNGCTSNTGVVGVLLGNGDGTFQTALTYGSGGYNAESVAIADVNGDGHSDLVVANDCQSVDESGRCEGPGVVSVLLGNGDGTFQTAVTYDSGGAEALSVAVSDLNDDGNPDLVVANRNSNDVGVLLSNGDGTFQTAVTHGSGGGIAYSAAVADVNGDGKPDVVVANFEGFPGNDDGTVGVLLGNGDGTFQTAVAYDAGQSWSVSIAVADVNGDGKPDLAVEYYGFNTVGVLLGNGDGTFQTAMLYGTGGGYSAFAVAVGDVNGDGKPDLLVANGWGESNGDGSVGVLINTSLGPTTTTLASSPNPSGFTQAVTFTAAVTSQFFKFQPTGTVSFYDGATNIGNSNLNGSGVATLTISTLAVGTHSITAVYNGDANFLPSTSLVLYQIVQGAIAVFSPTRACSH